MDPIAFVRAQLRKDTPASRKAAGLIRSVLNLRVPPTALHRLLLAERSTRTTVAYELMRALYYQPMFESQCESAGRGRLELTPESKLPFIDNCVLALGTNWKIYARTSFIGARNAPSKPRIEIGDGTYLGSRVVLRAGLGMRLGKHVTVGANVILCSDPGHPLDPVARRTQAAPREDLRHMVVGDDVWIAEGATLLGGITVGDGAVIGAHAVVTKDVPARTVVAGNPARVVRTLDDVAPVPALRSA
jgi:acetyltransferase-like isoleucine patch superfamily enzyme